MRRRFGAAFLLLTLLAGPARAEDSLVAELVAAAPSANPEVLTLAARAADCARKQGMLDGFHRLAVIDYSLPSTTPRLWVFDVDRGRLLFQELVAHGRNTGEQLAARFSNVEGSKMSSLGLFQATETYTGSNGYSLRLRGLDAGFNDNALSRAIVMHGAPYVSEAFAERLGRLGRSWGCPAVRKEVARVMIDTLKGGALLFAYYPDQKWLKEAPTLTCGTARGARVAAASAGTRPRG
ncbi:MAG: murein L,D-transpeptidase catalytic domain family protein [Steroidobacteraceae bacterium]|nr:murein L,D-transpeptidase catalytic domain family protein [Steroidobacteraceae bacterium]